MNTESNLIGKYLLVGITYVDEQGHVLEHFQTHGKIVSITDNEILIQNDRSNEPFSLPPDISNIHPAAPGEYRLKSTNESIFNPDFLSNWTVTKASLGKSQS